MSSSDEGKGFLAGFGMAGLVQGVIAVILAPLPVLGIPIAVAALVLAAIGTIGSLVGLWSSLKVSIGGIAVAGLALGLNVAIAYAPGGYDLDPVVPKKWNPVPDRPAVSPPARHNWQE